MNQDSNPRVMHVITGLGAGGAESMLTALALAKMKQGAAPVIVSLTPGGPNVARLSNEGVVVHQLNVRRRPLSGIRALARLIAREQPDVVQGWMYHANLAASVAVWLARARRRTKVYWGIRCSDMDVSDYGLILRVVIRAGAWFSKRPDAIIANSASGVSAHQKLGYTPHHFLLFDNGVDTQRFRPKLEDRAAVRAEFGLRASDFVIAVAARYDPMKDYPTLLSALEKTPWAKAIIMGADTHEKLPASPQITALGRRTDVPRLLRAADILISASAYGEGFSNAIVEAMATGLPVIATDVGDGRRIIGDTGRIVPPRDPGAIAAALHDLRDNDLKVLGAAARNRVTEEFSLARAVEIFDILHQQGPAAQELDPMRMDG
ncbi:MAG: glycosyltransferase involved in cell wall biosynthesis [Alphaproteobacteria bacterium]|jgi:glycosyltransferase involved in cell wall biosynthesis